jgi:beta-glucanase (GH16 family)
MTIPLFLFARRVCLPCGFCCLVLLSFCGKKSGPPTSSNNGPTPPDTTSPKPYQLVWSDEFNTDGAPDSSRWGYDSGGSGWGNNELEYYTANRQENARVQNGNLIIEAREESYGGRNYTSARLLTKYKAEWTYGKFEIRAKLPAGTGTWPAIWLLSGTDPLVWPNDGELDIMEEVGFNPNVIYGTAHNEMYNGANGTQKGSNVFVPTAQDSFHVYGLEWTANQVVWSVDSVAYFTYTDPGYGFNAWPYNSNFFLILNIAIGGNWGGQQGVDNSIFPQQMLVDYVRIYQRQ